MAVDPKPWTPEDTITVEGLEAELNAGIPPDFELPPTATPKRRGRKPGSTNKPRLILSKEELRRLIELPNMALASSQYRYYALVPPEIDALVDSWYEVLRLYPTAAKALLQGNKFTVWGMAIFTTIQIAEARIRMAKAMRAGVQGAVQTPHQTGTAHPDSGPQWNRQNGPTATPNDYEKAPSHFGYET